MAERETPCWTCKECGVLIPMLDGLFGAALREVHQREHRMEDVAQALTESRQRVAELEATLQRERTLWTQKEALYDAQLLLGMEGRVVTAH